MNDLARALIDRYQQDMPLEPRPYRAMAEALGVDEADVLETLSQLLDEDIISRVGPVFDHALAGASTLVATSVPAGQLNAIAEKVSSFNGVNHNYARDHHLNLWFVVTAPDQCSLDEQIENIGRAIGRPLLKLPMEKSYHIDLGFRIAWQGKNDERD